MLHIYLDKNKWIDLVRAAFGHTDGKRFLAIWQLCLEAVKIKIASFPLSDSHYMETANASDPERRRRLAATMLMLARPRDSIGPSTIASIPSILPMAEHLL